MRRHRAERRRGASFSALAAVGLTLLLLGWWWSAQAGVHHAPSTATATESVPATSGPGSVPVVSAQTTAPIFTPQAARPGSAVEPGQGNPPLHITYAAVGMDQAVVSLAPTLQELELNSIVPPHTPDAYWLSPYGMPGEGSMNTTYVVGHSWEGGASPFNNISTLAKAGDLLTVTTAEGQLDFKVDDVTTEYKETLRDSKIWDIVPGRLILITCYAADLWGKNIIVQASPLPAP
ncbi:class F sortase [Arthrobacter sp. Rue61a]|uniref:class F sortase n=1 Tax=Arthrobacter sp. Rue61a TaxID=1118963 RepID=UPI0025710534|nr:class F sortase [Arthrobacter sp. Rue61a]